MVESCANFRLIQDVIMRDGRVYWRSFPTEPVTKNKLGECCSIASKIERSTGRIPDPPLYVGNSAPPGDRTILISISGELVLIGDRTREPPTCYANAAVRQKMGPI